MNEETARAEARNKAQRATALAAAAWVNAPVHHKALAGAYVGPLLEAVAALNAELQLLRSLDKMSGDRPGA